MIENAQEIERLRRAFAAAPPLDPTEPDEPEVDAERIWRAVAGELSDAERREVVALVAASPAAAEAWRLAVELARAEHAAAGEREGAAVVPFRSALTPAPRSGHRALWSALAAAIVVALGLTVWMKMRPPVPSEMRGGGEVLVATVEDGTRLPRAAFRLAWQPVADAVQARYAVRVTTEDLRPIAEARDLPVPEYTVPASALAALPPGTRLLGQVEARLADGSVETSAVTLVVVAD